MYVRTDMKSIRSTVFWWNSIPISMPSINVNAPLSHVATSADGARIMFSAVQNPVAIMPINTPTRMTPLRGGNLISPEHYIKINFIRFIIIEVKLLSFVTKKM